MPAFTDREYRLCRLMAVASVCCWRDDRDDHLVVLSFDAKISAPPLPRTYDRRHADRDHTERPVRTRLG